MSDLSVRSLRLRLHLVIWILIVYHYVFQDVPRQVFLECHFSGLILIATSVLKLHKSIPPKLLEEAYLYLVVNLTSTSWICILFAWATANFWKNNCLEVVCNWLFGLVVWFSLRVREVLGSIPRTALLLHYLQLSAGKLCLGPNGRTTFHKSWSTIVRAPYGDRTRDHTLTKRMLYQLS